MDSLGSNPHFTDKLQIQRGRKVWISCLLVFSGPSLWVQAHGQNKPLRALPLLYAVTVPGIRDLTVNPQTHSPEQDKSRALCAMKKNNSVMT